MNDKEYSAFPAIRERKIADAVVQTVNARDLHLSLKNGDHFSGWIKARIEKYDFVENQDFVTVSEITETVKDGKTYKAARLDYYITIDTAKELAMVENNDEGRRVRRHFIECERRAKEGSNVTFLVPKTLPEALRLAADLADQLAEQKAVIIEMEPKATFHDRVAEAINCQSFEELAKILGTGRNRLYKWGRDNKLLRHNNLPYQQYIDAGYFRVVEKQYTDPRGESHIYNHTLITGKGLAYIQKRFDRKGDAA